MEKRLKSFSSYALHGSHTKIKVSDHPAHWASIALFKNFTIIYVSFSFKVFLLVTKHEPEVVKQQGEVQNDGSLSLVAPRSFKRRKMRNLKLSSWKPLNRLKCLIQVWQLVILWFIAFSLKPPRQSSVNLTFCLHSLPLICLEATKFPFIP